MPVCPRCGSERVVKNGHIHNGKQNYRCRGCKRQFVLNPTKKVISDKTKRRIDKLLLAQLPLAGSALALPAAPGTLDVSESWLQGYVNQKYKAVEQQVKVEQKRGR